MSAPLLSDLDNTTISMDNGDIEPQRSASSSSSPLFLLLDSARRWITIMLQHRYHPLLLLLVWTSLYILIGFYSFDTGGDIGKAVFVFIVVIGMGLLFDVVVLIIRPVVKLWILTHFDKAYHDNDNQDSMETIVGQVGRVDRHRVTMEYTVLLQRLQIIVVTDDEFETGDSVELRVLRSYPRSAVYLEEWEKHVQRTRCFSSIWLLLGTPFLIYYTMILANLTDLGGFPINMVIWHLAYTIPPAVLSGGNCWRQMKTSIVERATS